MPFRPSAAHVAANKLAEQRMWEHVDKGAWEAERAVRVTELLRRGRVISSSLQLRGIQPNVQFGTAEWGRTDKKLGAGRQAVTSTPRTTGYIVRESPPPKADIHTKPSNGIGIGPDGQIITWATTSGYEGSTAGQRFIRDAQFNSDDPVEGHHLDVVSTPDRGANLGHPIEDVERALAQFAFDQGITL
jgi:hypothetical protein